MLPAPWPAVVHACARPYCFGSAQADVRDESSTSCSLLRRCAACCRPLGRLLCAAVLPFWLGASRGPQQEQLELLVALAMRGLLLAPLLAAVRSGIIVLAWHRPMPATREARAAGRFGGARLAARTLAGCCAQQLYCFGSAQPDVRDKSSTSCGSLWQCVACCRRLWPAAVRSGLTVFGSAQAEGRNVSSTSWWSLWRCAAGCLRRLISCFAQRPYCFGSAQAEARNESSTRRC